MIRVNLLSTGRDPREQAKPSQLWALVFLLVVVASGVGLFLFHQTKLQEVSKAKAELEGTERKIADIQRVVANHEDVKKALAQLRAREDAIAKLQAGRRGPAAVLLELAQLSTPGQGPTADPERLRQLRKENPLAVYNPAWDARRLWLTSFSEAEHVVKMNGMARDSNDVSEFAQRLKLSSYFYDVQLLSGGMGSDAASELPVVTFSLQLRVRY